MFRGLRTLAAGGALVASLALVATPVLADTTPPPPTNDTYSGASVVPLPLPYEQTLDTTGATTDATDTEANANCGAPATLASVWYEFTPTTDDGYIVDVSRSSYEAGVIVVSGSPGSFVLETCGPFTVGFFGTAGTTYHILAFSDTAGVNGGTLVFHMEAAPPPPELTISVDPTGQFNARTGAATISGSWSCTGTADFTEIDISLTQSVGRFKIVGASAMPAGPCDGTVQPWSATILADNGKYAGGKSAAVAFTYACNFFTCSSGYAEQTVKLRR
jgi:hypothetical protein